MNAQLRRQCRQTFAHSALCIAAIMGTAARASRRDIPGQTLTANSTFTARTMAMKIQVRMAHVFTYGLPLFQIVACADIHSERSQVSIAPPGAGCSMVTGSRVATSAEHCSALRQSFSGEEIRNTGETSVGDALRRLDPSISTNH
jgi:hypothetical protein